MQPNYYYMIRTTKAPAILGASYQKVLAISTGMIYEEALKKDPSIATKNAQVFNLLGESVVSPDSQTYFMFRDLETGSEKVMSYLWVDADDIIPIDIIPITTITIPGLTTEKLADIATALKAIGIYNATITTDMG